MVKHNLEVIRSRFGPWVNVNCWVLCNSDKEPITLHSGDYLVDPCYHYSMCSRIRWKKEPQDHITNLERVLKVLDMLTESFGFGIMLGMNNVLMCYDLDHCVDKDGNVSPEVEEFLKVIGTYAEISSSGTGIHVVVGLDGKGIEYDLRKTFSEGKCYVARFLKLTGNTFRDCDLPIRFIDEEEFYAVQRRIGVVNTVVSNAPETPYTGDTTEWAKVLSEVHIKYEVVPNYKDIEKTHGDVKRTSVWVAKVQCPNRFNHTDYERRKNEFNPDVAILTVWDDGTTSLKCNHNHCAWYKKPNLLQKLWNDIRERRSQLARSTLSKFKVI